MRYFAKPNTWFDSETEAFYECSMVCGEDWPAIMSGTKDGKRDEEGCSEDEFIKVEDLNE